MSPWQEEIFKAVYEPRWNRVAIKTITQYGKSEVVSMALLSILKDRKEKILIVAPSGSQAAIIFDKLIDHLYEHPDISGMMTFESKEKLKKEESKTRITFTNGSEIFRLTADVRNLKREAKNLMGFGATIIVIDESGLIPDSMFTKILRMVGGTDGKIIQLGNPFENNHFGKAFGGKTQHGKFMAGRYYCISVNWETALAEGRVTEEFLKEARDDMTPLDWLIFYECQFPEGGAEDALIPRAWILLAVNQKDCRGDFKQSGLDVARYGRDKTVYTFRQGGEVQKIEKTEKMDTMEVSGWTRGRLREDRPDRHCTDVVGLGAGVHDRLEEVQGDDPEWEDCDLIPLNVGEAPTDVDSKKKFHNLRAQVFWHLRTLFKPDPVTGHSQISIPDNPELKKQLEEIRYKYSSERKIKIEAKDEMKKRLGYSPDEADSLAMAFWDYAETEPQLITASYDD